MALSLKRRSPSDTVDLEELEIELLLTAIARRYGYDFRSYAPASFRRRLRRAMRDAGVSTVSGLQDRLLHDPDALRQFIASISVHTTTMFRDPEFYRVFRDKVVPRLRTYPFIRIWHAGCATGEEVFSLAILLHEEGLYPRCRFYGTDLSDDLLARARRGIFSLSAMREHTQNYQRAGGTQDFSQYYLTDHENAIIREELRRNILFSQHNLVSDGSFNEFQVILCRNVLIYFDNALRDRVHRLFYDSLCPFGVLGLGMRESLQFTPYESDFEPLHSEVRLYRRRH